MQAADIRVRNIDREAAETAARIRAKYQNFKAFDSLQLACAVGGECDLFLTNDKQLRQFADVRCATVVDWEKDMQS